MGMRIKYNVISNLHLVHIRHCCFHFVIALAILKSCKKGLIIMLLGESLEIGRSNDDMHKAKTYALITNLITSQMVQIHDMCYYFYSTAHLHSSLYSCHLKIISIVSRPKSLCYGAE